jgi:hypothetical protein
MLLMVANGACRGFQDTYSTMVAAIYGGIVRAAIMVLIFWESFSVLRMMTCSALGEATDYCAEVPRASNSSKQRSGDVMFWLATASVLGSLVELAYVAHVLVFGKHRLIQVTSGADGSADLHGSKVIVRGTLNSTAAFGGALGVWSHYLSTSWPLLLRTVALQWAFAQIDKSVRKAGGTQLAAAHMVGVQVSGLLSLLLDALAVAAQARVAKQLALCETGASVPKASGGGYGGDGGDGGRPPPCTNSNQSSQNQSSQNQSQAHIQARSQDHCQAHVQARSRSKSRVRSRRQAGQRQRRQVAVSVMSNKVGGGADGDDGGDGGDGSFGRPSALDTTYKVVNMSLVLSLVKISSAGDRCVCVLAMHRWWKNSV